MAHISGEKARELLDDTTPGPWTATKDHIMRVGWEQRERERSPWNDDDLIPWLADESERVLMNPEPEWKPFTENRADMLLAAAAPELAATVGWLYGREADSVDSEGNAEWSFGLFREVATFGGIVYDLDGREHSPDAAVEYARALLAAAETARK